MRLQEETRCELLLSADDPELLDRLDQAAQRGERSPTRGPPVASVLHSLPSVSQA